MINRILPPVKLKQYIFISNEKVPLFYASWAFMIKKHQMLESSQQETLQYKIGIVDSTMDYGYRCPMGGTTEGIKELKKVPKHLGVKGKIKFFRTKKGKKVLHHVNWT